MDRFAIQPRYWIENSSGKTVVHLKAVPGVDSAEEILRFLRTGLPDGFKLNETPPMFGDVLEPLPPEPFATELPDNPAGLVDPSIHWARLLMLQAGLEALGVTGVNELKYVPSGWVSLIETACDGLASLLNTEPEAKFKILEIKEKFGTLRFYGRADGSAEFVRRANHILDWAQAASKQRCMVTGHFGYLDQAGWIITLCPAAMAWRRMYPDTFEECVYPTRP